MSDRAGADRGVCTDRSPPRDTPDSKEGFETGAWNADPASGIEISRWRGGFDAGFGPKSTDEIYNFEVDIHEVKFSQAPDSGCQTDLLGK